MRSSVLTLRKPIPLARAIRWVPAGLFTPPRTLDDLALFITQSALRDVMRHLRSDPEQELLGFLLGELYECPETGARYVMVNTAVRTSHAIAETDRILIPEEEWLGVQLEVRRRRTQLIGWYHSAPFVGPHPARADLDTHNALFTEPWQCGLVIATSGDAPTGAFFRSLLGERTGGGVLIPFYELPDEEEPIPVDGRKRTLIDWVNYETRGTVERDESERRPFVPSRPAKHDGAPVILSVPSAPEEEQEDERPPTAAAAPPSRPASPPPPPQSSPPPAAADRPRATDRQNGATRDDSPDVIPLAPRRPAADGGSVAPTSQSRTPDRANDAQTPRATTPRSGSGLVMLPSPAELEEMLAEPTSGERIGGGRTRSLLRYIAAAIVVGAVAYVYLINSGRIQRPGFLAGFPGFDVGGGASSTAFGSDAGDSPNPGVEGGRIPVDDRVSDSSGAALSSNDTQLAPSTSAGSAAATPASGAPISTSGPSAASSDPAVQRFYTVADSLDVSIRNFQDRSDDFAVHRITCDGLAIGYSAADDAFITLASAHRAARESLDTTAEARYRDLVNRMGRVNEDFGASGCPRP
jgi:proteasome lid subunit RPN8/RPN11